MQPSEMIETKYRVLDPLDGPTVLERVQEMWDLTQPFPVPKKSLQCPVCREGDFTMRSWRFFKRIPEGTLPYRCDVGMKCNTCSYILTFGVPVTKELFDSTPVRYELIRRKDAALFNHQEGEYETHEIDYYGGVKAS